MSNNRQNHAFYNSSQPPIEENEAFALCPQVFLTKLSPEEYRAQQELYRRAYERALAKIQGDTPSRPRN